MDSSCHWPEHGRHWLLHHLPSGAELSGRHFPEICGECCRGEQYVQLSSSLFSIHPPPVHYECKAVWVTRQDTAGIMQVPTTHKSMTTCPNPLDAQNDSHNTNNLISASLSSILFRRRFPTHHHAALPQRRRPLGHEHLWLLRRGLDSRAVLLLHLRQEDSPTE